MSIKDNEEEKKQEIDDDCLKEIPQHNDISSNEVKVNVNDLPKALYIFELQNDAEKTWKKVLVH